MSQNPVLTMSGVVFAGPENTQWRSGMNPHPTASYNRAGFRGPTISMSGVVSAAPCITHWNVPFPNGESIYVVALRRAEAKAALEARAALEAKVVPLPLPTGRRSTTNRRPAAA